MVKHWSINQDEVIKLGKLTEKGFLLQYFSLQLHVRRIIFVIINARKLYRAKDTT